MFFIYIIETLGVSNRQKNLTYRETFIDLTKLVKSSREESILYREEIEIFPSTINSIEENSNIHNRILYTAVFNDIGEEVFDI
jgi:hypothetical protein